MTKKSVSKVYPEVKNLMPFGPFSTLIFGLNPYAKAEMRDGVIEVGIYETHSGERRAVYVRLNEGLTNKIERAYPLALGDNLQVVGDGFVKPKSIFKRAIAQGRRPEGEKEGIFMLYNIDGAKFVDRLLDNLLYSNTS